MATAARLRHGHRAAVPPCEPAARRRAGRVGGDMHRSRRHAAPRVRTALQGQRCVVTWMSSPCLCLSSRRWPSARRVVLIRDVMLAAQAFPTSNVLPVVLSRRCGRVDRRLISLAVPSTCPQAFGALTTRVRCRLRCLLELFPVLLCACSSTRRVGDGVLQVLAPVSTASTSTCSRPRSCSTTTSSCRCSCLPATPCTRCAAASSMLW